jgi:cellulose biosynthesis protein BcsQ
VNAGGIEARSDEYAFGLHARSFGPGNIDLNVNGDVTASGGTQARAVFLAAPESGSLRAEVTGKVSAAGGSDSAGAEIELVQLEGREKRLKRSIDKVRDKYDYIFINCPPSLGLLTINSLTAVESVLIPIQCEFYALEVVTKLLESMKMVKARLNRGLYVYGVLMTMYDGRTTLSKQVVEEVERYFGDTMFRTVIPRSVKVSEAPSHGEPVTLYEPNNKGALAYRDLAKEVEERG